MLKRIFNKSAVRRAMATVGVMLAGFGFASAADAQSPFENKQFVLKNDLGERRGVIEFRKCEGDLMCAFAKEAAPEVRRDLGIPPNATDHMVAYRLRANGNGLADGLLIYPGSSLKNGAAVNVTPKGDGKYEIVVSKFIASERGILEPKR